MQKETNWQRPFMFHLNPQLNKNKRSIQISRINHRISLLKKQIQKQKDQTSVDKNRLKQINEFGKLFEKKLFDEIGKCKQFEKLQLSRGKDKTDGYLRQQSLNGDLILNKTLQYQDEIYSKQYFNKEITLEHSLQKSLQKQIIKNTIIKQHQPKQIINQEKSIRQSNSKVRQIINQEKKIRQSNWKVKNFNFYERTKNVYLKEIFLTSIILFLVGKLLRQYLQIF